MMGTVKSCLVEHPVAPCKIRGQADLPVSPDACDVVRSAESETDILSGFDHEDPSHTHRHCRRRAFWL